MNYTVLHKSWMRAFFMKIYTEKKSRSSFLISCVFISLVLSSFFLQTCTTDSNNQPILPDKYIAGYTKNDSIPSVFVPCYWKNEARTDLDVIDDTKDGYAESIFVSDSDIYIAGYTKNDSIPSVFVPCYWKNEARTDLLDVIDDTKDGYAQSIFVSDSDIYVAGYTINSSGFEVPCYWKNGSRTDLSVLDQTKPGSAQSIYVD